MRREPTSIATYVPAPAVCRPYDPRAADVARQMAELIESKLPAIDVEHVGSTSVPGCAGKGIVDLMVLYSDGQLACTRESLDALGFQRQTGRDPFPEDRPMRVGAVDHNGSMFRLHVHIISRSSNEVEVMRRFRDRLRADPQLVSDYVVAKRAILESGCTDSVDYCERKSAFVARVLDARKT